MQSFFLMLFTAVLTSGAHAAPNDIIRNYPAVKVAANTYVIMVRWASLQ